jgi:hypothetical protein
VLDAVATRALVGGGDGRYGVVSVGSHEIFAGVFDTETLR